MKDNFSQQAEVYAKYRPGYPGIMFDFIAGQVPGRDKAWDCGTGNGQTAKELAKYFTKVFATDISMQQLDHAFPVDNVFYSLQPAEKTDFDDNFFDLVTVSQALHWFDFGEFYKEVIRVTKPGGLIAAWTYSLLRISPAIDKWINDHFYLTTLLGYWDPERKFVDEQYRTIPFPFREIACPAFTIELQWSLGLMEGYLNSWSAVKHFIHANGYNPVDELIKNIRPLWEGTEMPVKFPVHMRMGKIEK